MRALARRPHTAAELHDKLRRRFDSATADVVTQKLLAEGLLDDTAFAVAWRSSRERHRPRSAALVRQELVSHGVPVETASQAVEGMDDDALAIQAAQAHMRSLDRLDEQTFIRRLAAYLGRRGFGAPVVRRTVIHFLDLRRRQSSASAFLE